MFKKRDKVVITKTKNYEIVDKTGKDYYERRGPKSEYKKLKEGTIGKIASDWDYTNSTDNRFIVELDESIWKQEGMGFDKIFFVLVEQKFLKQQQIKGSQMSKETIIDLVLKEAKIKQAQVTAKEYPILEKVKGFSPKTKKDIIGVALQIVFEYDNWTEEHVSEMYKLQRVNYSADDLYAMTNAADQLKKSGMGYKNAEAELKKLTSGKPEVKPKPEPYKPPPLPYIFVSWEENSYTADGPTGGGIWGAVYVSKKDEKSKRLLKQIWRNVKSKLKEYWHKPDITNDGSYKFDFHFGEGDDKTKDLVLASPTLKKVMQTFPNINIESGQEYLK